MVSARERPATLKPSATASMVLFSFIYYWSVLIFLFVVVFSDVNFLCLFALKTIAPTQGQQAASGKQSPGGRFRNGSGVEGEDSVAVPGGAQREVAQIYRCAAFGNLPERV